MVACILGGTTICIGLGPDKLELLKCVTQPNEVINFQVAFSSIPVTSGGRHHHPLWVRVSAAELALGRLVK